MKILPEGISLERLDYWDIFYDVKNRDETMIAVITSVVTPKTLDSRYWEVQFPDAPGIYGIVPFSESGLPRKTMMGHLVGQEINVKIIKIDKKANKVACTRREVVEKAHRFLVNTLKTNEEVTAVVRFTTEFHLALDIGAGVIVFVPRAEAKQAKGIPLNIQYCPGQIIQAVVTVNKEADEITATVKDPWENTTFKRGDIVSGKVVKNQNRILFVEVKPGIVGIASCPRNTKPQTGTKFTFQVTAFDQTEKNLRMNIFNREWVEGRRQIRERRQRNKNQQLGEKTPSAK